MREHFYGYVQKHHGTVTWLAPLLSGLALGTASLISSLGTTDILFGSLSNAFIGGFIYGSFFNMALGLVCVIFVALSNPLHRASKLSTAYAYTLPALSIMAIALLMLLGNIYTRLLGHS